MALFSLAILICFAGAIAGGLSFAIWLLASVGALHVDDLSDTQFEGHQLLPENGAWRRFRRDPVFHLRRRRSGAPGHGGRQRRIRSSQIWLCPCNAYSQRFCLRGCFSTGYITRPRNVWSSWIRANTVQQNLNATSAEWSKK